MNTPHRYNRTQLLRLREKECCCLSRPTRRRLFYFNIYVKHIPVVWTARRSAVSSLSRLHTLERDKPQERALVRIKPISFPRKRRRVPTAPSLLLTNLRSICNKFDEVSLTLSVHSPDIAVFTESWLDGETPDSSISVPSYNIVRKDRNSRGGGIVSYISDKFSFSVLDILDVPNFPHCDSEILPIFFSGEFLLVLCVYHPFWRDNQKNSECITALVHIIDCVDFSCPKSK